MLRFIFFALAALAFFAHAPMARAHRAHAALSEIVRKSGTETVEITHRVYAHDIEPYLFGAAGANWDAPDDTIAVLGRYTMAHFSLRGDDKPLALDFVGAESEGEFIYLYATANLPAYTRHLVVNNALLMDVHDDQVDLVNIVDDGRTQSAYFRFGDEGHDFDLEKR